MNNREEKEQINHPEHYQNIPNIECIDVVEHMNFNIGNAIKYCWRAGVKSNDPKVDLEKAIWYLQREIERLGSEGEAKKDSTLSPTRNPSRGSYYTFRSNRNEA